jgi:transcriptional regulator with XRE-family HTH domain
VAAEVQAAAVQPAVLVRSARQLARLSQRGLAQRAGVPASVIAAIESGQRPPSYGLLCRLLEACGLELALVPATPELDDAAREHLRLSTSDRLYLGVGGRANPRSDLTCRPWLELGALARCAVVSLAPATARSVWLYEPCLQPVAYVHRWLGTEVPPLRRLIAVELDGPVPQGAIPVGVHSECSVWVPTPGALALQPELAPDAPRLRAVDRYLHEAAPRDAAGRRRPSHRVSRPYAEEWRIRQDRRFGPLKDLPSTLDRREWRAGGVVSFSQWLTAHGYPDPRHPEPALERDADDDLTLAELLGLHDPERHQPGDPHGHQPDDAESCREETDGAA